MDDQGQSNLPEVKKKKKVKHTFQRPPHSNEFFTDENKRLFDSQPAYARHFIDQFLKTGNLKLAARQANMNRELAKVEGDLGEAKAKDVKDLLSSHGMGPGDLVNYLHECVKAEALIRDKHGVMHKTVDLKVRLQALDLILRLTGEYEKKGRPPAAAAIDLFKGIELEDVSENTK